MFHTKVVEKNNTHIFSITKKTKNCAVYNVEYCRAGQATDDDMTHAHAG
jgi:hypothetical protein